MRQPIRPVEGVLAATVGIDLGTTNTVVSHLVAGRPETVVNADGARHTPSVVAFTADGSVLAGEAARRQAVANPHRTFSAFKRAVGSSWSVDVDGRRVDATLLSSLLLRKVKADAEAYLGTNVTKAVIAVPARFDDAARRATREAGEMAGLEVLRLVSEPAAAAFSHQLDRRGAGSALVFDMGGGTFDVAVIRIEQGLFDVRSTAGDVHLGGEDFDQAVIEHLLAGMAPDAAAVVKADRAAMFRLKEAAEAARIDLSSRTKTRIELPYLATAEGGPVHLEQELSRTVLEELTAPLLERTRGPFTRALMDAGVSTDRLSDVVLVGGMAQMPALSALVGRLSGGRSIFRPVDPSEAVASGAALSAGVVSGQVKDVLLLDVTPLSLGIETRGGGTFPLIPRNTTIPTSRTETFTNAHDGQTSVEIHVVQGERVRAVDNMTLGRFTLSGITPAPRASARIDVTFDLDADGVMHISARELSSGASASLLVSEGVRMSREAADSAVEAARAAAADDAAAAGDLRLRLRAETLERQVASVLARTSGSMEAGLMSEVSEALTRLRAAMDASAGAEAGLYDAMVELRTLCLRMADGLAPALSAPADVSPQLD